MGFKPGAGRRLIRAFLLLLNEIRYLPKRWLVGGALEFLHSEEQDITLRDHRRRIRRPPAVPNQHPHIILYSGVVFTNEVFQNAPDSRKNLETLVGARVRIWRFGSTEFDTDLRAYPNLSELGGVRSDLNAYLQF